MRRQVLQVLHTQALLNYRHQLKLHNSFWSSGSIATIIGFVAGTTYPSSQQSTSQSLSSTLTPVGSTVNSIIMQCSLVNNPVTVPSDILDSMPIKETSFGSNITHDQVLKNLYVYQTEHLTISHFRSETKI